MPNIMITNCCNLRCPYCFANEFVNNDIQCSDITIDNFKKALDFILSDGTTHEVGIIGGEPTCHNNFDKILKILENDDRAESVTIYTNGIELSQYIDAFKNKKFHLLINCNSPKNMGQGLFERMVSSISDIYKAGFQDKITFGVNFYNIEFKADYIFSILNKFQTKKLRVSISVPNSNEYGYSPLNYFKEIKKPVLSFFKQLMEINVIPFFDCNIFPSCLVDMEEIMQFKKWGAENPFMLLKAKQTGCMPVIDIMQDLKAVRCFGLSEYTKVDIRNFASLSDLRNYYFRTIDAFAANCYHSSECNNCYKYTSLKCSGGCLIYKISHIINMRKKCEEYLEGKIVGDTVD